MMKPYKVVNEDDQWVTYEFRTIYMYLLYVILAVALAGFWTGIGWLSFAGGGLMVLFFLTVSIPAIPFHSRIRKAMRQNGVELSGSKWSFVQPLKIKLVKGVATTEANASSG